MEPVFLLQRFVVLFFELKNFPYVYAASSVLWMASSSWKMETREVWNIHGKRANYVVLYILLAMAHIEGAHYDHSFICIETGILW